MRADIHHGPEPRLHQQARGVARYVEVVNELGLSHPADRMLLKEGNR